MLIALNRDSIPYTSGTMGASGVRKSLTRMSSRLAGTPRLMLRIR